MITSLLPKILVPNAERQNNPQDPNCDPNNDAKCCCRCRWRRIIIIIIWNPIGIWCRWRPRWHRRSPWPRHRWVRRRWSSRWWWCRKISWHYRTSCGIIKLGFCDSKFLWWKSSRVSISWVAKTHGGNNFIAKDGGYNFLFTLFKRLILYQKDSWNFLQGFSGVCHLD